MDKIQGAFSTFNNQAQKYQDKFMDMDLYHDSFDLFCGHIPKANADILEIGCGPGNITRYLLSKRPDFQITGIDFAPNMIALAKSNNPSAQFHVMDARDIDKIDTKYDGIISGFCMPYLSKNEVMKLISNSSKLLRNNGIIYLSTMEEAYEKSRYIASSDGKNQTYTYFHEADYLQEFLANNGFEIMTLLRQDYPQRDGSFTTDMVLIAKKN